MKWHKRLFSLCLVCVCLFVLGSSSLTVSAMSIGVNLNADNYVLESVQFKPYNDTAWRTPDDYHFTTLENNGGQLYFGLWSSGTSRTCETWRAKFTPQASAGSMTVQPYMMLNCNIFYNMTAGSNYSAQTITGALYLTTSDGIVYEFPVTDQIDMYDDAGTFMGYNVTIGGSVEVGTEFDTGDCSIEFMLSGVSNMSSVDVSFFQLTFNASEVITENTAKIVESVEQGFADLQEQQKDLTQDIIDNADSNTQDIIDNDNANAEKTHGFLQDIVDTIMNLPAKLWQLISDGLKSLFVPDQDYIAGYKDKWDTLLANRFGAVYEASSIITDWAGGLKDATATGYIDLPAVSIDLPDNNKFTFGPYTVDIIPDGFEFLVDVSKLITSVVAVLLLVNALRKRWESVMDAN